MESGTRFTQLEQEFRLL